MSSILDALKKLETEKEEAERRIERNLDADDAERDLVGRSLLRERLTIRLTPLTLFAGALALLVLIVGGSTLSVLLITRSATKTPPVAPMAASAPTASSEVTAPSIKQVQHASPTIQQEIPAPAPPENKKPPTTGADNETRIIAPLAETPPPGNRTGNENHCASSRN